MGDFNLEMFLEELSNKLKGELGELEFDFKKIPIASTKIFGGLGSF